ncbi:regulatory protein YcgZ [Erwinia sp. BNK-24-b]|uniref:regulatory protein YcgZ n=1 Tax=Erwinia TaxID=551 RepID=UPI001FEF2FE5|nr:regulatory protein YcgZ [Erwinia phyllosphaerae]MBV4365166.1 two-component-system connector protein YcgZ [Erwinia phyllosphaerae]
MRQDSFNSQTAEMSLYFSADAVPSHQETLGQVVMEILKCGMTVNRQSICAKLLSRLADSQQADLEKHHHELIAMLFGREI